MRIWTKSLYIFMYIKRLSPHWKTFFGTTLRAGVRTGVSLLVSQHSCFQPIKKKKKKPQDFADLAEASGAVLLEWHEAVNHHVLKITVASSYTYPAELLARVEILSARDCRGSTACQDMIWISYLSAPGKHAGRSDRQDTWWGYKLIYTKAALISSQ